MTKLISDNWASRLLVNVTLRLLVDYRDGKSFTGESLRALSAAIDSWEQFETLNWAGNFERMPDYPISENLFEPQPAGKE